MLWNRLHFTAEGHLTACCSDYENDLIYDEYDDSKNLSEQFNNTVIKSLRKRHLENNLEGLICKNCIYNTNDKYSKLKDVEINDKEKSKVKIEDFENRNNIIKQL